MASARTEKNFWLMKSEPEVFSIVDLARDGVGQWDGVRNYQVRNMFRDAVKAGDWALFYHSNAKVTGCSGIMEIVGEAYPDPTQFDAVSSYFDSKADMTNPRWLCLPVRFVEQFPRVVTLAEMRADAFLHEMLVLKRGNRLSVTPVSADHFKHIQKLAQKN